MRFRADDEGAITATGEKLKTYDLEVSTDLIPAQLMTSEFAGVGVVSGMLVWLGVDPPAPVAFNDSALAGS